MLPEKLTEAHPHLLNAGATADVLVKIKGFTNLTIGRYFHVLEEWQVNGFTGAPIVEEWWYMPQVGTGHKTGKKVND